MRIGPNAPCWCGSGKKFKRCHRDREAQAAVPGAQIRQEFVQHFHRKICMHPAAPADCGGAIIEAHTLQRRGAIERIADRESKVLSFNANWRDAFCEPTLKNLGWRKASTFTGFCARHDQIFAPLEAHPFIGTPEQCFLVGYRAICHELYQKLAADRAYPAVRDLVDRGRPIAKQIELQHRLNVGQAGRQKGLTDIRAMKRTFDDALSHRDFETNLRSCVIQFDGDISVASTGLVHPDFDAQNLRIQNLSNPNLPIQGLSFGVVATASGGAVVFSWRRTDDLVTRFINSICNQPIDRVPGILVEFMFAYVSNTFFSSKWWDGLTRSQQRRVGGLAGTQIQYGSPVNYSDTRYVAWTNLVISRNGA